MSSASEPFDNELEPFDDEVDGFDDELEDLDEDDFDDIDDEYDEVNRVAGATARNVLVYIAKAIVEDPESVEVEVEEHHRSVNLRLHVDPNDLGRVIGRRGRVAQSIRTVVRAAGARDGINAHVDIVD